MSNKAEIIAVHCSFTKPDMDIGAAEIKRWHTDPKPRGRGWRDIGYAEIIRRDGTVEKGRDLDNDGDVFEEIGAHVAGFNSRAIGICLVGGMDFTGKPDANFTRFQYAALESRIKFIFQYFNRELIVKGHRDFPNVSKDCPCFDVEEWWYGTKR